MQDLQNKAEKFFESNPDADKVFSTSDGILFAQEMYATAHAATINKRSSGGKTAQLLAEKADEVRILHPV